MFQRIQSTLRRRQIGLSNIKMVNMNATCLAALAKGASLRIGDSGISKPLIDMSGIVFVCYAFIFSSCKGNQFIEIEQILMLKIQIGLIFLKLTLKFKPS